MADTPLHYQTITEVAEGLRSREISPVELTQAILDRIAALDGQLKSYATVMAEPAMESARAAESEIAAGRYRGGLHGVPIAVKDLCFTTGVPTMGGAKALRDFIPDFDGTVVRKLNEAGAIILGKLNLTEGAMAGYNPEFDIPINPWGADRWGRRVVQRFRRGHGGRPLLRLAGQRHRRFNTLSGGGLWHRGDQAHLGPRQSLRRVGAGRIAGPRRPHDPQRRRRRHHAASPGRPRRQRSHVIARAGTRYAGRPGPGRCRRSASAWMRSTSAAAKLMPRWPRPSWPARVCWKAWAQRTGAGTDARHAALLPRLGRPLLRRSRYCPPGHLPLPGRRLRPLVPRLAGEGTRLHRG